LNNYRRTVFLLLIFIWVFSSCDSEKNSKRLLKSNNKISIGNEFDLLVKKYEDPERDSWQHPELVLEKLGDLDNKIVADIGSGTGYFTFRIAEQAKKVVAIDIDSRFLNFIEERKSEVFPSIAGKVETRKAEVNDPNLDVEEIDIVLLVNTYLFIEDRVEYLKKLKSSLKQNGFVMIVDYNLKKSPYDLQDVQKIGEEKTIEELKKAGFFIVELDDVSLDYQFIAIARK
jgi:SAM-dependent methyltransferase